MFDHEVKRCWKSLAIASVAMTGCGMPSEGGAPLAQGNSTSEATADSVVELLSAQSPEFQNAGEAIRREKKLNPSVLSQMDPFLTDPVDLTEPGIYRVKIQLPAGTDTSNVNFMGPGDVDKFVSLSVGIEPEAQVVEDGVAYVILSVTKVLAPYEDYQLWVQ